MHKLLEKVEKELHNIAETGISSANLDTTYKYLELIGALSEECFPFVSQNATFYPKCPNECSNTKLNC